MYLLTLVFICVSVIVVVRSSGIGDPALDQDWAVFKETFHKNYKDENENNIRRIIWENNLKYIFRHHHKTRFGENSFKLGINQFTDMTLQEYQAVTNIGYGRKSISRSSAGKLFQRPLTIPCVSSCPDQVDWRKKGYVTPVVNQGSMGSSVPISAIGSLTGQHFKLTGRIPSISTQNILDCCKNISYSPEGVFRCCVSLGGIDTEEAYPNITGPCRFKKENVGVTCWNYVSVQKGDENALKVAVATVGPISVVIDAGHQSFQLYRSGVYDEPSCSSTRLDHAVLIVGYGTDSNGADYWIIKNSWGTSWGMEGYILMARNRKNQCGIASDASYPLNLLKNDVVEQGYPSSKRGYLYEILGNKAKTNGYYKRQKSRKMYPSKPCYWLLVSCY
ncbi:cathepsin L-like peptidase [Tubulanus polymorphus]|uniref:cathepsin L-like peptidase n=1 Tax=Tubulanus polymorphus TaxID=672921 RepID=UPI003DA33294